MPRVLEATVLLVVTFMSSGERLYSDNPWTYTRCSEQLSGYQLVVGGFSPDGVHVSTPATSTTTTTASLVSCGSSRSLVIGTLVLALDFCPLAFGNLVFSFLPNKHF